MGEEKFYSPREDLEALIAAMGTLETAMETLDTSTQQLITAFLLPQSEATIAKSFVFTAAFEDEIVSNEAVSATDDIFIRRIRLRLITDKNPWFDKDVDVLYAGDSTVGLLFYEFICNGTQQAIPADAGETIWLTIRDVIIPDILLPAGELLAIHLDNRGVPLPARALIDIWYRKLVT